MSGCRGNRKGLPRKRGVPDRGGKLPGKGSDIPSVYIRRIPPMYLPAGRVVQVLNGILRFHGYSRRP